MTFFLPTSNCKTLDNIRIRKQNRDPNCLDKKRPVVAMDTETDEGDIFLLAVSDSKYLDDISFEKIAKFLLRYEGYWIFFYNLQYDAECILKLLPKEILQRYKWKKVLEFEYKGYKVHYIDRKKLTVSKGHHTITCYDIAQYYEGKTLASAYSDSISKPLDPQYLVMKEKRKILSKHYYSRHKKEVRNYCIQDCILTKELAENWLETFYNTFGFYVANWISSGYLAEKVLIKNGIYIPLFNEIPYEIQELARQCFYGGRFELIQRGFIGYCCLYDINSAYPYALTTLPDITDGRWIRRKSIHPDSKIGVFDIIADIDPTVKIAPFPFIKKNGTICYPSGKFRTYVTLDELKMVEGDPRIKYKILESYQFIPNKNCRYPFKKFIEEQYDRRMKLKKSGNKLEKAIKIILNSIYGKTAQRTNKVMGNLFNPVIASYITGFTRAYLYRFMKENKLENDVVAFATDSIAVRKKIPNLDSEKLGDMKLDKEADDVIFLSNGFYLFNGIWKKRGIGYDNEKKQEIEHELTRIDRDGSLYIGVKTTRTTHIKSGILYNMLKKVGKIEEYEKKINLNSDKKRFWLSELKSLNDRSFCDSVSMPIDLVGKLVSKEEVEFCDDEKYEPESEL
ncbi:MAG: DNA polymerase [Thaumarchaeota archaeon]|nr:DNA polymerase [Nitrososphaerota archaeon]